LAAVVQIIEGTGATISSIVTLANRAGLKEAVIRVATINPGPAIKALEALEFTVREPWRG
jgi:hypothetical protein